MLATINRPTKEVTWGLAAGIALVLAVGVFGALTTSDDNGPSTASPPTTTAGPSQQANRDAAAVAAADQKAYDQILANQTACNTRYLPDARARHQAALNQLKEQEAALKAVLNQLPPGKAKDVLSAQLGPDFESSTQVVESELKSAESRCALAFTVYQYTHPSPPPG